jgi:PAS domain S-box-containing protein
MFANDILRVQGDNNYPPYEYLDENGEPAGFNVDLFKEVCNVMGLKYDLSLDAWDSVRKRLHNNEIDVLMGMYYSEDRERFYDFSQPHTYVSSAIVSFKEEPYKILDDLYKKSVLVQKNDAMHDLLIRAEIVEHIVPKADPEACIKSLLSENHDAVLLSSVFQAHYLVNRIGKGKLVVHKTDDLLKKYCFAVQNNNSELVFKLNEGLMILKQNGVYDRLLEKWYGIETLTKNTSKKSINQNILLFAIILLIMVLVWVFTLEKKIKEKTNELSKKLLDSKNSEKEIKQNSERLQKIIKSLDSLVFIFDQDFRFVESYFSNDEELLFRDRSLYINKDFRDVLPPNISVKLVKAIKQLNDTSEQQKFTYSLELNEGIKWYEAKVSFIKGSSKSEKYIAIVKNITDKEQTQEQLNFTASRFDTLFHGAGDAIMLVSDSRITKFNSKVLEMFQYTDAEMQDKHLSDLFPKIQSNGTPSRILSERLLNSATPGSHQRFYWTHKRKNGEIFETEVILSLFIIEEKRVFQAIIRDITERIHFENELKKNKTFVENIINSMNFVLISIDENLNISQWNSFAENRYKILTRDAVGLKVTNLIKELYLYEQNIIDAIHNGHLSKNLSLSNKNAEIVEILTIYPLRGFHLKGAVLLIDDVSEFKRLQTELFQSQKMDAIGKLAGGIAHDFNNMLGGILGASEILERNIDKADSKSKFVKIIKDSASSASELTSKLLSFSRKTKIDMQYIDMNQVIIKSTTMLERSIKKKIKIRLELANESLVTYANAAQLENVFLNLGINANHAMPNGGELVFKTNIVTIDEQYCAHSLFDISKGSYIQVQVADTGTGIPAEILEKIFEPFFTTKEEGEGTGLGLSSVFGIIKQHKGAIDVSSKVNVGTTFTLYFILEERNKLKSEKEIMKAKKVQKNASVLVVDDEPVIRATAKAILEDIGYSVETASNGLSAKEIIQNNQQFDLYIVDLIMPEFDGRDVFYLLKETNPNAKIILCSGFSNSQAISKLMDDGLSAFLKKPYTYQQISATVSDVLGE